MENYLDWKNVKILHEYTQQKSPDAKIKMCRHRQHNLKCVKDYLAQHPLIEMMAGQPAAISIVASLAVKFSLKEIY